MYLPFTQARRDLVCGGTEHADTYRVKQVHATEPCYGRQRRFPQKTRAKYMKSLQAGVREDMLVHDSGRGKPDRQR